MTGKNGAEKETVEAVFVSPWEEGWGMCLELLAAAAGDGQVDEEGCQRESDEDG